MWQLVWRGMWDVCGVWTCLARCVRIGHIWTPTATALPLWLAMIAYNWHWPPTTTPSIWSLPGGGRADVKILLCWRLVGWMATLISFISRSEVEQTGGLNLPNFFFNVYSFACRDIVTVFTYNWKIPFHLCIEHNEHEYIEMLIRSSHWGC